MVTDDEESADDELDTPVLNPSRHEAATVHVAPNRFNSKKESHLNRPDDNKIEKVFARRDVRGRQYNHIDPADIEVYFGPSGLSTR